MRRRPPRSTRTDTLFPYTTLFRSARQTFVIVLGLDLDLAEVDGIVGLHAAGETGALDRFGAQVIERLDAKLPRTEMEHQEVRFLDIGGDEEIERGRLFDIGRAIGREFQQPALVDLESGQTGSAP